MAKAIVFGNGESRAGIDLHQYKEFTTIGCNAIHRDFTVDHLVCCDARMVREALDNSKTDSSKIHVRDNWHHYFRKILKNKHIQLLPELPYHGDLRCDQPVHWGSGPYAVLIAANLDVDEIWLLGFDLYGKQGKINNLYKGTNNYNQVNSNAVDHSYWQYQIAKIFEYYPNKKFAILNRSHWKLPEEWQKNNVKRIDI